MKLLLDENLSMRLVSALADLYPEMSHVHELGLGTVPDEAVWSYARQHGFAIVSKDSDFAERSVLETNPAKVIWIRLGNCSTRAVEQLLRSAFVEVRLFLEEDTETCLLLGRS